MTTYTPDLCDEVLVLRGPHAGGVGTVTDIKFERDEYPLYFAEGMTPNGGPFSRWYMADDLAPVEWGTWRFQITTVADPETPILSADITDRPIEPVEMILEGLHEVPWIIVEGRDARRVGVATRHIETVEVFVIDRRSHRVLPSSP